MTSCPVCGKQVDALRAPAVGVRDGRVVSYCSKEHASASERVPSAGAAGAGGKEPAVDAPPSPAGEGAPPAAPAAPAAARAASDVAAALPAGARPAAPAPRGAGATPPARGARPGGSVQLAETGRIDDVVTADRRKAPLVALGLVVAAGGAIAGAYSLGVFSDRRDASAPVPAMAAGSGPVAAPAPIPVAGPGSAEPPAAVTAEQALARATEVLRARMRSDSPRVQRVAASALARTRDQAAIELLIAALGKEAGELARIEIAYAIARAGDKRGFDALVAAAVPGKREAKHDAGSRLAMLGDARAVKLLEPSLQYPQFRLGVAETLARLAVPSALQVLVEVRADARSLPDERARSIIALGLAGRQEVIPELTAMLGDDRNNAFAAVALASMHQEAARPVLEKQLAIPSLRVQAARALRQLAPGADPAPLLPALIAALDSDKDTEQVQVAEALLVIAGPVAWSERE